VGDPCELLSRAGRQQSSPTILVGNRLPRRGTRPAAAAHGSANRFGLGWMRSSSGSALNTSGRDQPHPRMLAPAALSGPRDRRPCRSPPPRRTPLTVTCFHEWHHSLPAIIDPMRARIKNHARKDHQPWPARRRHARLLTRQCCYPSRCIADDVRPPTLNPPCNLTSLSSNLDSGDIIEDHA
jgi:hypothetical protein